MCFALHSTSEHPVQNITRYPVEHGLRPTSGGRGKVRNRWHPENAQKKRPHRDSRLVSHLDTQLQLPFGSAFGPCFDIFVFTMFVFQLTCEGSPLSD